MYNKKIKLYVTTKYPKIKQSALFCETYFVLIKNIYL